MIIIDPLGSQKKKKVLQLKLSGEIPRNINIFVYVFVYVGREFTVHICWKTSKFPPARSSDSDVDG
jgi:hypothetical protein